jgi:hypothetical protein
VDNGGTTIALVGTDDACGDGARSFENRHDDRVFEKSNN